MDSVVIAARAPMHQLEIVDHDHVDVVPHLGLTSLQLQTELVHDRSVVNENHGFAQWT